MARCLALGIAIWASASLLVHRIDPSPDELVPLRWLRVVAEHPVRGSLGLALLLGAALRARSSASSSDRSTVAGTKAESVSENPEPPS
jgi:hypothetical protein